ncbi:MAG: COX15/CtaA family protein [Planctomycetota bacterium]
MKDSTTQIIIPGWSPPAYRPWLHRFSYLVIAATFALIAIGGKVTSIDAGLAVPDGFTTFGHFTLTAPLELWWHDQGTRWEHSHRIQGMVVGMLTIALAAWLLVTQKSRPWLRFSGLVMLALVSSQGVLGALRVAETSLVMAFVHGICGQLILCGWIVIAAALSRSWIDRLGQTASGSGSRPSRIMGRAMLLLIAALFVQLVLGAGVRHFKADKAIPDFPFHYGQVLPPMSQASVDEAYLGHYADRMGVTVTKARELDIAHNRDALGNPIVSAGHVHLQFVHRFWAYLIVIGVIVLFVKLYKSRLNEELVTLPALMFTGLLALQVSLGAFTVMTGTDPIIATAHQAVGALLIATATWLAVRVHLAECDLPATSTASTAITTTATARPEPSAATPRPA